MTQYHSNSNTINLNKENFTEVMEWARMRLNGNCPNLNDFMNAGFSDPDHNILLDIAAIDSNASTKHFV
jgi:hypothetical protein